METKQVNFAYPTSTNAELFGCGDTGCWLVETGKGAFDHPHNPVSCHTTEREAIDAAYALDLPWSHNWMFCAKFKPIEPIAVNR